jgi:hypothetical protein
VLPGKYRLTEATIAFLPPDGHHISHTVPTGAIIVVPDGIDGNKRVELHLDGNTIMMFTQDLRLRSVLIEP